MEKYSETRIHSLLTIDQRKYGGGIVFSVATSIGTLSCEMYGDEYMPLLENSKSEDLACKEKATADICALVFRENGIKVKKAA